MGQGSGVAHAAQAPVIAMGLSRFLRSVGTDRQAHKRAPPARGLARVGLHGTMYGTAHGHRVVPAFGAVGNRGGMYEAEGSVIAVTC